jgi:hypothetical protein
MPDKQPPSGPGRRTALLALALVLVILSPLGYSLVQRVVADEPDVFLEPVDPKHEKCIWGTSAAEMRLHHWERLRTIRENVVRYGNRTEDGLARCKECHLHRDRFCDRCHEAVSLTPDCFHCHHYPTSGEAAVHEPRAAAAGADGPRGRREP